MAGWSSGRELSELKASLETIRKAANELITDIDGHLAQLQQEREAKQQAEQPQEQQTPDQTEAPSLDPTAEPVVTVLWSESPHLKEGQTMPLHEADALFAKLDAEYPAGMGYDKTKFRIEFTFRGQPDNYEGRQDFGDGDGSLIQHIQSYHEYYAQDESWKNHVIAETGLEGWEQDKTERDMLLGEFVPYLKLHCNLSQMEQEARRPLHSGEELTPEQAAYFHAVLDYVQESRPLLNQGQYQLPEPPKLYTVDHYPSDDFVFSSHGYDLHIDNELVAAAFAELPQKAQSILILHCVLEMADGEIGALMGMSRSAVQRHRTKTLKELRTKLMALMPEGG